MINQILGVFRTKKNKKTNMTVQEDALGVYNRIKKFYFRIIFNPDCMYLILLFM